jgi:hypothetical protein
MIRSVRLKSPLIAIGLGAYRSILIRTAPVVLQTKPSDGTEHPLGNEGEMDNVFSERVNFNVAIKPEMEVAIHTFSAGGMEKGEISVFVDAFYQELTYEPAIGPIQKIALGMTILALKFPEWLANQEYRNAYDALTGKLESTGMTVDGSFVRETKTMIGLDKAALIREAIRRLDTTCDIAKSQFEPPAKK